MNRPLPLLLLAALLSCSKGGGPAVGPAAAAPAPPASAQDDRVVLTGEIEAIQADNLMVPQTPDPILTVTWLAEDGAAVKKGERVAEFDSAAYAATLEDRRATLEGAESDLRSELAREAGELADKTVAVEQKRAALEQAAVQGGVPADLVSPREHHEKQLALTKAGYDLTKAQEDLATLGRTAALDRSIKEVAQARARRELAEVERRLSDLTLLSRRDGFVLLALNRQEGRKILIGDKLWVGMTVAAIPDLSAMQVRAKLSDVDVGAAREGMSAECVLDAYPQQRWPGTVRAVSPVAASVSRDNPLRFFDVIVSLDGTTPDFMRPGMSVRVEVIRRRAAAGAP